MIAAATPTLPSMSATLDPLDSLSCTNARVPLNCTLPPSSDVTLPIVKTMPPLTTSSLESRHWLKVSVSVSPLDSDWLLSASLTVVVIEPLSEHGSVDEVVAAGRVALAMLVLWRSARAATSRAGRRTATALCGAPPTPSRSTGRPHHLPPRRAASARTPGRR